MVLNKRNIPTARWDHDNNKWCLDNVYTYQWTTIDDVPVSDWMDFDNALIWIKEHDESKETS